MTSFIAARGTGRSTSLIPDVAAAWSVTTIAFIVHLLVCGISWSVTTSHPQCPLWVAVGAGLVLGRAGAVCSEFSEFFRRRRQSRFVYVDQPPFGLSPPAGAIRARPE